VGQASRLGTAGLALTAQGGSAHLEFEPARLRRVADCADGDTDHLPQDVAAEQSKLTADIATDGHLGSMARPSLLRELPATERGLRTRAALVAAARKVFERLGKIAFKPDACVMA
jgi:hypothetical protein